MAATGEGKSEAASTRHDSSLTLSPRRYVNDKTQNNPSYEFWPSRGGPIGLNFLLNTLPANLYPLTWLLPSGNIFLQANLGTEIFDYVNNVEYALPDIPHAVR